MKRYSLILLGLLLILPPLSSVPTQAVDTVLVLPVLVIGGSQGSGNSQFNEPDSVYVDADGTIFAGDSDNLRIQIFSSDGTYLREITGFTPKAESSGNEVQGIGELSNGTLVVVEKVGNLYSFNKDTGEMTNKIDMRSLISLSSWDTQGLVVDRRTDYIYISNQPEQKILVIAGNGSLVQEIDLPAFATPENMAIDEKNERLFISSEGLSRIDVYHLNGTADTFFGGTDVNINYEGLAIDPLGHIIAVSEGPNSATSSIEARIIIFNSSSLEAMFAWGSSGHTAEGEFLSPDGIAYDFTYNRVLIADQGNYRIQVFDYINILKSSGIHDDTTAPTITDQADVSAQLEVDTNIILSWTVSDEDFIGGYDLTQDGVSVASGRFDFAGEVITFNASSLAEGIYVFELNATDAFGNSAIDTATLTIAAAPTSSSEPVTSTTASETSTSETSTDTDSPYPMLWGGIFVVITTFVYRKRK